MRIKIFVTRLKKFLKDILFPKSCIICGKEGSYLCQDCLSLIPIEEYQYCPFSKPPKIVLDGRTSLSYRKTRKLDGLFCATTYHNFIVRKAIKSFKYPPYIKELARPLSSLIINHLELLNKNKNDFKDFIIVPIPLHPKEQKKRGYNQAQEIASEISKFLDRPIRNQILRRTKNTPSQTKLNKKTREKNMKGSFTVNPFWVNKIRNKKILLIDDVFTTGATMEECAKILKQQGAKEVWGMVIARE